MAKKTKGGRPTVTSALYEVEKAANAGGAEVDQVTVKFLQNGKAAWRVYRTGEKEPQGGVIRL